MQSYPIIVIGAGAGGLVIAIGAARAGKKVLLIEKGNWGGDCTNFGCIPSKSLIASAHAAFLATHSETLGIRTGCRTVDPTESLKRLRAIVADVRAHEDSKALEQLGVCVAVGTASFLDPHTLQVSSAEGKCDSFHGKKIVIATGSSPQIPSIQGLAGTPYLTNETVFELNHIPKSLIILGGGPIGSELAQAMRRLGSEVTQLQRASSLLMKEEPAAQEVILNVFQQEGICVHVGCQVHGVSYSSGQFSVAITSKQQPVHTTLGAEQLLVAAGRIPHVAALNLNAAGIAFSEKGIQTDAFCRTSQPHIFAVGDVTGGPIFTHAAEHQARAVLASLLLPWNKRCDKQPMPRVTFTDPEVASIGLSEKQALQCYGAKKIALYTVPFTQVDRALTNGRTEGFVKIVTKKWSSKILGATLVGPRAGEMLMQISLAMHANIPLRKLAHLIHPYPIDNQAIRKAADQWLTKTILPLFRRQK